MDVEFVKQQWGQVMTKIRRDGIKGIEESTSIDVWSLQLFSGDVPMTSSILSET